MHNVATIQRSVFCGGGARCASHRKERRAASQAVVLPLRYGLSLSQTAEALGISATWASRLRNAFLDGHSVGDGSVPARGGRRRENFTREREAELLKPFIEKAAVGGILVVGQLKPILEKARGRPMALSSVYNLLHRHGWRKLAPDKRHPQSDPVAQDAFKKNFPSSSPGSVKTSPKARRSG